VVICVRKTGGDLRREHFFDGYKADSPYALETLKAAIRGGARRWRCVIPRRHHALEWKGSCARSRRRSTIAGHPYAHDGECAVINSLMAVREGATQVQGTINGYGERCGNVNLCSSWPTWN